MPKAYTDEFGFTEELYSDEGHFEQLYHVALAAVINGVQVLRSNEWQQKDGWKMEKTVSWKDSASPDFVYSKSLNERGKTFAFVGEINCSAQEVFDEMWHNAEALSDWNPSVAEYKRLIQIGSQCQLTYSRSHDALGGLVKPREHVDARCWRRLDKHTVVLGCKHAPYNDGVPSVKGSVRAETILAVVQLRAVPERDDVCHLSWLFQADIKGYLPRSVVEKVSSHLLLDYISHLRVQMERKLQQYTTTA